MIGKRISIALVSFALAAGLAPCLAFAASADDAQAAEQSLATQLTTQATKDITKCTIKFTDDIHVCGDADFWQMYYADGEDEAVEPEFNLYYNGKKVSPSKYTVKYQLTWWDDEAEKEKFKTVKKSNLIPSASPNADDTDMSSEYRVVITAKSGSGFEGKYTAASVCVADRYNFGRFMDTWLKKAKASWKYNINPMNGNYYVIPQANAAATLKSFTAMEGCTPGDGGMNHDGTKVASKYYTVTYYKAKKKAVEKNMSPASSAKTGKKLASMPTTAGSYVMVIKGNKPYYGTASILFDIQDKAANLTVSKVSDKKYTGSAITPAVTVKYKGKTLKKGVDYTVTYKNNTDVGTAKIIIKGCNKIKTNPRGEIITKSADRFFKGTKTITFKIVK